MCSLSITARTINGSPGAISHGSEDKGWCVLKVDIGTISFVEDSFLEVVSMVDVKVPSSNIAHTQILPRDSGRLDIPDD